MCRRIAKVVRDAGHSIVVIAPNYPNGPPPPAGDELRIPSLPFPPYPSIRMSLPQYQRVARFLEEARPDVVHAATEGPLGFLGRRWALRHGVPLVTSFHTHFPQYIRYYGGALLAPLVWKWLVRFHRPARLTHTPGEAMRDELVARGIRQAVVWGRGVDTQHLDRKSVV